MPPPAVSVLELPMHTLPVGVMVAVIVGAVTFTDTVCVAVFTQPLASVPVTVYVTVVVGDAVTLAPVVADSAVFGDHVYVVPPDAVSAVELPIQIVTSAPAVIVGKAFTVTTRVAVFTHPLAFVPVIV